MRILEPPSSSRAPHPFHHDGIPPPAPAKAWCVGHVYIYDYIATYSPRSIPSPFHQARKVKTNKSESVKVSGLRPPPHPLP
ncbi:hypothetical protein BDY21DRAFT_339218 [Lineolata rhizophorae]|uniref:Uncharacterized protein n=1 Tax=Lineolata rhizophorae TaxID=578093 RepID=A0A6A6P4I8_9PEZI|nr:hypothetical protein BDY21DRAFT_339218 [Lineolata rhizophorae]